MDIENFTKIGQFPDLRGIFFPIRGSDLLQNERSMEAMS